MYSTGLLVFLVGVASLLGMAGGYLLKSLWSWIDKLGSDRLQLRQDLDVLRTELEELRASSLKRHTQSTEAALGDAIGIAIDILKEYESGRRYTEARTCQLYNVLVTAQKGPYGYQKGTPAGQRPARRHDSYND